MTFTQKFDSYAPLMAIPSQPVLAMTRRQTRQTSAKTDSGRAYTRMMRDLLARGMDGETERVMAAWKNDEWYYCGVILSVAIEGLTLDRFAASLWGIEVNYPDSDNAYLTEVANELLSEALETAKAERARQCAILCETEALA